MVNVIDVHKTFKSRKRTVKAVDGANFSAKPGRVFGLLGPNGAGKTTTLRMISTLLKPNKGKVEVYGYDTAKNPTEVRKRIGFLTSDMKLSGNLSPRELLYFFAELSKVPKDKAKERINELASYLDMESFLDETVKKLSTGMKQKASLAVSLIHDPEVIVFDEPTNGLDILTARTVTEFIKDFRDQQKTVIISTHVMSVAEKLCDDVAIILEGKLVENDNISNLYEKYKTDDLEEIFFRVAETQGVTQNV